MAYKIKQIGTTNSYLCYDKTYSKTVKLHKVYSSLRGANKVADQEHGEVVEFDIIKSDLVSKFIEALDKSNY